MAWPLKPLLLVIVYLLFVRLVAQWFVSQNLCKARFLFSPVPVHDGCQCENHMNIV